MSYYRQGPFRPSGSSVTIGFPPVTPYLKMIMIACGAVWLLQVLLFNFGPRQGGVDLLTAYLGVVPYDVVFRVRIWQPLTYMFLHAPQTLTHLLFNMLFLWMFGGDLERHWGSRAFLRYYLICGIGGGVSATLLGLTQPASAGVPTIGASGALFGLMMAFGMIFAERTVLFMLIFPMKARTMAMILFAIAAFFTFTGQGGGISHVGHLGGALTGFLYLKRAWRVADFYRELRWKIRRRRFRVMNQDSRDDFDRWVN